jgi:thiamine pyrophosphokinase
MSNSIVHSFDPVTLVGGGEATSDDLHKALTLAPICVAADGGAALALNAGVHIEAVIGDFDSITADTLSRVPSDRLHKIAEQDSTDFEKALRHINAPVVLGVGFLGGRIDHQLAAFHSLTAMPDRPCVLIGTDEVICLAPPEITLPTCAGDVVSLFPMGQVAGRSAGLQWPIEGLEFVPTSKIGTSNRALGEVTLQMEAPRMLLILPRRLMSELVGLLAQQDAARLSAHAR